jgi:hypothetical protein
MGNQAATAEKEPKVTEEVSEEQEFDTAWGETDEPEASGDDSAYEPVEDDEPEPQPAESHGDSDEADDEPEEGDEAGDEADEGDGEPADDDRAAGDDDSGSDDGAEEPEASAEEAEPNPLDKQLEKLEALTRKLEKGGEGDQEQESEQAQEQPIYSEEEQRVLEEFQAEWPEVSQGIELMFRKQKQQLMQEVRQQFEPLVVPAYEMAQQMQGDQHYNQLVEAHPDYDTIHADVIGWIEKQPEYLKNAFTHVAQEGSTQDVIDMISRFKAETGVSTDQGQSQTPRTRQAPRARKRQPDEAKQAAQSLGVVNSQRSSTPGVEDPNDFDSAWNEAD